MKNIKLIILDVDGTLTDGKLYYDYFGNEFKSFSVKDGMGISFAIKKGIQFAIITGRKSIIVTRRAEELGIEFVFQGIDNKKECMLKLLNELDISKNECLYIGDDINDIECMSLVEYRGCPNDASEEVKSISNLISSFNGGDGAVREIVQIVLKNQDKWIEDKIQFKIIQ